MAAIAGYLATVHVTGTPTALTGEAMSDISGGAKTSFQITNTDKQLVDPSTAIVITDTDTGAPWAGTFTIDYLTGTVTLNAAAALSITITGKYLPKRQIAQAYEADVSLSRTLADSSILGTDFSLRTSALGDISGSFACYDSGLNVYTDVDLAQILVDGSTKLVEMNWNGTNLLRFFALFEGIESSMSVDGVQTASVTFQMNAQTALTTGQEVDFTIL